MNITQDTAVTLDYRITDAQGKPLDAGTTAYLHGGYDNLFAKAEAALQGKTVGDKVALALSAAEAFGARDEALARRIPKSEFPPGVTVGGQVQRRAARAGGLPRGQDQGPRGAAGRQPPAGRPGHPLRRHRQGGARGHRRGDRAPPRARCAWASPLTAKLLNA